MSSSISSSSSSPPPYSSDGEQSKILYLSFDFLYQELDCVYEYTSLKELGQLISRENDEPYEEKQFCKVHLRIDVPADKVAHVKRMITSQNRLLESSIYYKKIKEVNYLPETNNIDNNQDFD